MLESTIELTEEELFAIELEEMFSEYGDYVAAFGEVDEYEARCDRERSEDFSRRGIKKWADPFTGPDDSFT